LKNCLSLHREPFASDVVGRGEGGIGITAGRRECRGDIAAGLFEQQRSPLDRSLPVYHRRQRVDVDRHQLLSVFRHGGTGGQDHGDRLANIADLA
jgi:hypothetical protein